jgi:hypothetical protein
VGILPAWGENNRNELASGRAKTPVIHPVLIDRELPKLQARLDELNKIAAAANQTDASDAKPAGGLTPDEKKEFIAITSQLKLLTDRREKILARTGDEYVVDPPKVAAKL